ncbi:MAG: AsmA family protein [Caldimonas sp.]
MIKFLERRFTGSKVKVGVVALCLGVALAVLVAVFDWNWFRPALERHLSSRSHRSVKIDDFDITFSRSFDPTFHLRGVKIANAAWADDRPFIAAGELTATCQLASLIHKRPVITHLLLVDADVDFERQADGLRNWRLTRPDDRGPGIVRILALEPLRSRIRFVHRGIDLDVQTATWSVPASPQPSLPNTRIDFEGTYRGADFRGSALTDPVLTFRDTGQTFAVRGHAAAGRTRLDVDGRVADILQLGAVDAHLSLQGASLAELRAFVARALPASLPYVVDAQFKKDAGRYAISAARFKTGSTDIEGTLSLDTTGEVDSLHATLSSQLTHLEDLAWVKSFVATRAKGAPGSKSAAAEPPATPGSAAAAQDIRAPKGLEADVRFQIKRLTTAAVPITAGLEATTKLANGVWTVAPFDLQIAGGHATGRATYDTIKSPSALQLEIDVRSVEIKRIFPDLPEQKRISGSIGGGLRLTAHGRSIDEWLDSASGSVSARMLEGSMSRRLDAELGLSGSRLIGAMLAGPERVTINCAAADFDFHAGRGRFRTLALDTERTHVEGTGTLDLHSHEVDLLLTPDPGRSGLLELRKSIRVRGRPGQVTYTLADATPGHKGRPCTETKTVGQPTPRKPAAPISR